MHATVKSVSLKIFRFPLSLAYIIIGILFHEDRRISKRLSRYFPTYSSFFGELSNQVLRWIGSSKSFMPQGIVIEPTNCCNLKCLHCTTQSIEDKRGYMDYGLYKKLIDENPQLTCIILTRNGEPLLHPDLNKMVRHAKSRNIYVSIYTNGILLSKEKSDELLDVGLDEINFSMEGVGESYERNRRTPYQALKQNMEYIIAKSRSIGSRIRIGVNVTRISDDDHDVKMISAEWEGKVDHIDVEPLMGKVGFSREKSCRTLWRNAAVRWDGMVLPCCTDMRSALIMGDLNIDPLRKIFNGDRATRIRKSHIDKKYPAVCKQCSYLAG